MCQGSTDLYVDISFGSLGVEDRHRCPETWPWHCESTSQTGSRKNTTEAVSSQMSPKSGPCWLTHQCTSKKVWFSYLLQQSVQKWDILLQQSYLLADALLSKLTWPRSLLWFTTTRIPTKLHQFLLCRQTHWQWHTDTWTDGSKNNTRFARCSWRACGKAEGRPLSELNILVHVLQEQFFVLIQSSYDNRSLFIHSQTVSTKRNFSEFRFGTCYLELAF